jgi:hypothetical protein
MTYDIDAIAGQFALEGTLIRSEPFGTGHINDTFCLTYQLQDATYQTVLQRINHFVFKQPLQVMENIQRITTHIQTKLRQQGSDLAERQLVVYPTRQAQSCFQDDQGNTWRMCNRIENALTLETLASPDMAHECARMFGWFQCMLVDLSGDPLHETIVDFHHTPKRLQAFEEALAQDPCQRAQGAREEIDFVLENSRLCSVLLDEVADGHIPIRITHNDTKLNNVMLDEQTKKGVCVIDLDTVMPGLSLYDFGDMVRTVTNPAVEDEQDLSRVRMRIDMFEALVRGFVGQTHGFLTPAEKKHLAFAGTLITFEQMIRFLMDHLLGDVYYKIDRENHNLDRCRTQMKLIQSIFAQQEQMDAVVAIAFKNIHQ